MAGVLLIGSLIFALQMTAVTPLSASTSNEYVENQQGAMAEGVLAVAAEDGSLKQAVLMWNETAGRFQGTDSDGFYKSATPPPNALIAHLSDAFSDEGVAFNVYVKYREGDNTRPKRMFYQGEPSDSAMTAARTVTLYDTDRLSPSSTPLDQSATYFVSDRGANNPLYSVVKIEVVVWRM